MSNQGRKETISNARNKQNETPIIRNEATPNSNIGKKKKKKTTESDTHLTDSLYEHVKTPEIIPNENNKSG